MSSSPPVDYGYVLEVTFVLTVLVGAPVIALASLFVELDSWTARVVFATTLAGALWFVFAVVIYASVRTGMLSP